MGLFEPETTTELLILSWQ